MNYREAIPLIYRDYGIKGFYQGYWGQFARDVPSFGVWFFSYQYSLKVMGITPEEQANAIQIENLMAGQWAAWKTCLKILTAGGNAGMFSWASIYPVDVIKSYVQVRSDPDLTLARAAREIYAANGFKGFFTGLAPCLVRSFPANAAIFFMYELTSKMITNRYGI